MKKAVVVCILFVSVLLSGCYPLSLYPIYTDETLIFEPALLGSWAFPNEDITYSFSSNGEKGYKLIITGGEDGPTYFYAYLCDIGGTIFLDLYPYYESIENSVYSGHLMRLHSFYVVEQFDPTLKIAALDTDWLQTYLEDNPSAFDGGMFDDYFVFTSSTAELQTFLSATVKDDAVFFESYELVRTTVVHF